MFLKNFIPTLVKYYILNDIYKYLYVKQNN